MAKVQAFEFDVWKPVSRSSLSRGKNQYGEWVDGIVYTDLGLVQVYAEDGHATFRTFVGGKVIEGTVRGKAATLHIPRLSMMATQFAATVKSRCRTKAAR